MYVEGSPYVNYPTAPEENVGGSIISLNYLIKGLNADQFTSSVFLFYNSFLFNGFKSVPTKISIKTKEYRRRKTKKPINILFNEDFYLFLSYLKRSILHMVPSAFRMYSFLKKNNPDIVHCNDTLKLNMDSILAARLAGIPCICHVRGYEKLHFINKICASFVKYFICVSKAVSNNYFKQGISKEKLVVIPNGLDIKDFPIPAHQHRSEQKFIITTIGRMVHWKGHKELLKTIPRILQERKNVEFWIVGDGELRKDLEIIATNLDIDQHIKFKGFTKDIVSLLLRTDLVVHIPTKPEPFGRIVIEAMALEKPVIVTNMGGPSEIITDGQDGILIEPNNPDQLAREVLKLLDDQDLREKIGKAARSKVEKMYDNMKTVKEVEQIYYKVLKDHAKKGI